MAKSTRTSFKPLYIIFILSLLISLGYVYFSRSRLAVSPAPAGIFAINQVSLESGDVTLSGTLQKDSPVGKKGNFLLVLPDLRSIVLDAKGLDTLNGLPVTVSGYLSIPTTEGDPYVMLVSQISAN